MKYLIYDVDGRVEMTGQAPDGADLSSFPRKILLNDSDILPNISTIYVENGIIVSIPPKPSEFYAFDYATKQWIPQLARAKEAKIKAVIVEYKRQKELPLSYDAKILDTNEEAREQLLFKAFEFAERTRLSQPAGAAARVWENADNTFFVFDTDTQFRNWLGGFVITLSNRIAQQRLALRTHVQNIRALTTVKDILAYDITVGWPL